MAMPSLSYPAAMPTGFLKVKPKCLDRFCGSRVKQFKQYACEEKIARVTQGVQRKFVGALRVEAEEIGTDAVVHYFFLLPSLFQKLSRLFDLILLHLARLLPNSPAIV